SVRRDDINISNFAGEVQVPAIRNRGSGEPFTPVAEPFAVTERAGPGIETTEHAEINAGEHMLAHDNGRLHVIALAVMDPGYGGIGSANLRRRNIALRVEPDGAHRAKSAMAAGEICQ